VEEFIDAVWRVAAGGTAMDAQVISKLFERQRASTDDNRRVLAVLASLKRSRAA